MGHAGCSPPPPSLGHADVGGADIALEAQVGCRFYGDGWGTGGYDVSADTAFLEEDTALEANVSPDTSLEAQGGVRFYGNGGGKGGHDSHSARMQHIGGPHTLGCLFIDGGRLFTSPPL